MKRVRVIRSHVGVSRYFAECAEEVVGEIPRQPAIPSPYAYSPRWSVWQHETDGAVIVRETRHKYYEVFAVPAEMIEPCEAQP